MELGIFLPTSSPELSGDTVLDCARAADQGGLDSVWVIDRMVFPLIEAFTMLAALSSVTSKVKLGTSVLIAPAREPVLLAAQTASIDVLSKGRMILGVGVGSRAEDYTITEREFHTRGKRLNADLELMRRVWAGESVVEGFGPTGLRPVNGSIPLLFGGSSDAAMARAAKYGDGHLCVPRSATIQGQMFEKFMGHWSAAGRTEKPKMYAQAYCCVDDNVERARERIADYQEYYYGRRPRASGGVAGQEEFDLVGTPEQIGQAMVKYAQLGADGLVLFPAVSDPAQVEAIAGPVREAFEKALASA